MCVSCVREIHQTIHIWGDLSTRKQFRHIITVCSSAMRNQMRALYLIQKTQSLGRRRDLYELWAIDRLNWYFFLHISVFLWLFVNFQFFLFIRHSNAIIASSVEHMLAAAKTSVPIPRSFSVHQNITH